jgi:hypothetical protein
LGAVGGSSSDVAYVPVSPPGGTIRAWLVALATHIAQVHTEELGVGADGCRVVEVWVEPRVAGSRGCAASDPGSATSLLALPRRASGAPGSFHALVIGNNAYTHLPALSKCVNDAQDTADLLASKGYAVTLVKDGCLAAMQDALEGFASKLQAGCTVVVYFSGHGVCVSDRNYLVPVDGGAASTGTVDSSQGVFKLRGLPCCPSQSVTVHTWCPTTADESCTEP